MPSNIRWIHFHHRSMHGYQFIKMRNGKNAAAASAIKSASNALTAKKIGTENSGGPNWSTIRAERMKTILNLKFRQNHTGNPVSSIHCHCIVTYDNFVGRQKLFGLYGLSDDRAVKKLSESCQRLVINLPL